MTKEANLHNSFYKIFQTLHVKLDPFQVLCLILNLKLNCISSPKITATQIHFKLSVVPRRTAINTDGTTILSLEFSTH